MEDLTIASLIEQSYETAKSKGWWDDADSPERNFGMKLMLMVSEISEALEEYRHGRAIDEIWYGENEKPEGIPVEMADLLIRVFDMCGHHKIPLERALTEKLAYNKTRSYRHGNKIA
jgi:NTP pyrophosphatase (non-canonical NTP hydrolase)